MKISGLPLAVNYAKPESKLTQYNPVKGKIQTVSENTISETKFFASLVSSDNVYTKESAILKQWNKKGSFNLYDVMAGEKVNLQNPNPSTEELQALEKELQEECLQGEIDWNDFEFDLKGIGFQTDSPTYKLSENDFNKKIDYLTSRYAAMQNKIQNEYSGKEKEKQLQKLDSLYGTALEEVAKGYSDILGTFLEENGVSNERENIYDAVIRGANDKVQEYSNRLVQNQGFASFMDDKDKWLLQDDEYVASLLRGEDGKELSVNSAGDIYTLDELNILGNYVVGLSNLENSRPEIFMDEERIGLDFAMLTMKTEELRKNRNVSSSFDRILTKTLNGFMNGFLNRFDNKLTDLRKANLALKDERGFAALDRQAIWDAYNETIKEYKISGNVMEALSKGAKYGMIKANGKADSGTYRYVNNHFYWSNFFENTVEKQGYRDKETTYSKYANGWADFKDSLKEGEGVRFHMDLKSANLYNLSTCQYVNVSI